GYLYDNGFGFRNGPLFFIASIVMFLSTIPMIFIPEGGIEPTQEPIIELNKINTNKTDYKTVFIVFIIALVFVNFGRNSIATIYSQYLVLDDGFNVDAILLSYIANARSIAVLISGIITGRVSRKFGDEDEKAAAVLLIWNNLFYLPRAVLLIFFDKKYIR
ncbi:MAG: hypothetical protein R6U84_04100, partial [Candidatus Cloacimonadales bacterium]